MLEPIAGILSVKIFIRAAEFRKVLKSEDCKVDLKKLFLSAAAVLTAAGVSAAEIEFKAPLTGSEWKLVEDSPLRCTLEHKIPDYGSVMFTSVAGKNQNMSFRLKSTREPVQSGMVEVRAVAPNYRPGIPDEKIADLKNYKYFGGEIEGLDAMNVISALSQSRNIAMVYNDPLYRGKQLQVTVNNINFRRSYREFETCITKLLPYSFADVAFTIVGFKPQSSELTDDSKRRLDMLITYLAYDPGIEDLVIDSYTDSFGTAERNRQISRERADTIGKYIEQSGIAAELMRKNGMGEKQHIVSNATEEGRSLNRRVVISVQHSFEQDLNYRYDDSDPVSAAPKEDKKSDGASGSAGPEGSSSSAAAVKQPQPPKKDTAARGRTVTAGSTEQLMKELENGEPEDVNAISAAQGAAPSLGGTSPAVPAAVKTPVREPM